jgi:hypothetical protein
MEKCFERSDVRKEASVKFQHSQETWQTVLGEDRFGSVRPVP